MDAPTLTDDDFARMDAIADDLGMDRARFRAYVVASLARDRGAPDDDVAVLGSPKRVFPMRLEIVGVSRGTPRVAPEDIDARDDAAESGLPA